MPSSTRISGSSGSEASGGGTSASCVDASGAGLSAHGSEQERALGSGDFVFRRFRARPEPRFARCRTASSSSTGRARIGGLARSNDASVIAVTSSGADCTSTPVSSSSMSSSSSTTISMSTSSSDESWRTVPKNGVDALRLGDGRYAARGGARSRARAQRRVRRARLRCSTTGATGDGVREGSGGGALRRTTMGSGRVSISARICRDRLDGRREQRRDFLSLFDDWELDRDDRRRCRSRDDRELDRDDRRRRRSRDDRRRRRRGDGCRRASLASARKDGSGVEASALSRSLGFALEPRERAVCRRAIDGNERGLDLANERGDSTTRRATRRAKQRRRRRARVHEQRIEQGTKIRFRVGFIRGASAVYAHAAVAFEVNLGRSDAPWRHDGLIGGGEHEIPGAFADERHRMHRRSGKNFRNRDAHALPPRTSTPCSPR